MIATVIVLSCVLAYAVIGLLMGRRVYASRYRRVLTRRRRMYTYLYRSEDDVRELRGDPDVVMPALLTVLFWPIALLFVGLRPGGRGLLQWWTAPLDQHEARVAQLRSDAEMWDEKRHTGTKTEREMAGELAKLCRQQVKELES